MRAILGISGRDLLGDAYRKRGYAGAMPPDGYSPERHVRGLWPRLSESTVNYALRSFRPRVRKAKRIGRVTVDVTADEKDQQRKNTRGKTLIGKKCPV